METKQVIIIRHGDYNKVEDYPLSDYGKEQMKKLATLLCPKIKNKKIIFICSIARRAAESAEILKEVWKKNGIDLPLDKYYELWGGSDGYNTKRRLKEKENKEVSVQNFDWFKNFINESDYEVLIAVTHLEFIEYFPDCLGLEFRNYCENIPGKGGARILDLKIKKQEFIHNE